MTYYVKLGVASPLARRVSYGLGVDGVRFGDGPHEGAGDVFASLGGEDGPLLGGEGWLRARMTAAVVYTSSGREVRTLHCDLAGGNRLRVRLAWCGACGWHRLASGFESPLGALVGDAAKSDPTCPGCGAELSLEPCTAHHTFGKCAGCDGECPL